MIECVIPVANLGEVLRNRQVISARNGNFLIIGSANVLLEGRKLYQIACVEKLHVCMLEQSNGLNRESKPIFICKIEHKTGGRRH